MRRFSTSLGMPALGCTTSGSAVSRTARSTAPSSPSGPMPQFMPQAIGCGRAGGQRGQHPLDRLAGGRLALPDDARRKARTARRAAGAWRPRSAPAPSRLGCVSKRMKSAPPSIRAVDLFDDHLVDRALRTAAGWAAGRSSRPRTSADRPRRPPRGRAARRRG